MSRLLYAFRYQQNEETSAVKTSTVLPAAQSQIS